LEDQEVESLESNLRLRKKIQEEVVSFTDEVQRLAMETRILDEFKGRFHCKAVLASLYF
jgi:hypothetical protein